MAYDPATSQLVLFGGFDGAADFADTWAYTGTSWAQLAPKTSPPGRDSASMAYDPSTGQPVLYGGCIGYLQTPGCKSVPADTWGWDGTSWARQSPVTTAGVSDLAPMDYDAASGQLVLLNGAGPGNVAATWTYTTIWDGHWLVTADGGVFSFGAPSTAPWATPT